MKKEEKSHGRAIREIGLRPGVRTKILNGAVRRYSNSIAYCTYKKDKRSIFHREERPKGDSRLNSFPSCEKGKTQFLPDTAESHSPVVPPFESSLWAETEVMKKHDDICKVKNNRP